MNIKERIRPNIIDKLGVDSHLVTEDASFSDDLGADSLDVFELLSVLEKEFDINIPGEDAEKITTVGALYKYIARRTEKVH